MSDFEFGGRLAMGLSMGVLFGMLGAAAYFGASKRRRFADVLLALGAGLVAAASDALSNGLGIRMIPAVQGRTIAAAAFAFAAVAFLGIFISRFKQLHRTKSREPSPLHHLTVNGALRPPSSSGDAYR